MQAGQVIDIFSYLSSNLKFSQIELVVPSTLRLRSGAGSWFFKCSQNRKRILPKAISSPEFKISMAVILLPNLDCPARLMKVPLTEPKSLTFHSPAS